MFESIKNYNKINFIIKFIKIIMEINDINYWTIRILNLP